MEAEKAFLSVKDLVIEYTSEDSTVHAVNGVSFDIKKGETLGLVGETGAGKTTIARGILRILPDPPARVVGGEVLLEGKSLMDMSEKEMLDIRGNKISMIFQDPMTALNPTMTVGEQIAENISLHNKHLSRAEVEKKSMEMLEMVGITAERHVEYPFQFSGGMKQRVVIAMALACSPDLLLADEPTTALDVTIQAQILEMIKELQQKHQTSMLLITHDLGVVAEMCDKVAVIYAGEIVEYGDKFQVFDNPSHPYTKGLFDSLPKIHEDTERLKPIRGLTPDPSRLPRGCKFHPRCEYATGECEEGSISVNEVEKGHYCRCCHCLKQEDKK